LYCECIPYGINLNEPKYMFYKSGNVYMCIMFIESQKKTQECRLSQMGNDVTNITLNSYEHNLFGTDMHS